MAELGEVQVRRVRSVLPAVIALLLVGNAVALAAHEPSDVGAEVEQAPRVVHSDAPPEVEASSTTLPSRTPSTKAPAQPKRGASAQPTTTTAPPQFPEVTDGEFTYDVTLEPRCVRPGQDITATFRLKPNADVVALPVYQDGPDREQYFTGKTEDKSVLLYTWKALPRLGHGLLTSQAVDKDTGKKGTVTRRFQVSATGTC